MISAGDLRKGTTFEDGGQVYTVIDFLHVKPGKGAAFMKTKLKNLRTGGTLEKTFNTSLKFEKANLTKTNVQYLYSTGDTYCFMNMNTYEQIELSKDQIGDDSKYLKENLNLDLTFYEGELLGVSLPDKIEYKVTKTEPAVKGNTTNNATKDAEIETGMVVRVPLCIEEGEMIVISTKDGKYASRA